MTSTFAPRFALLSSLIVPPETNPCVYPGLFLSICVLNAVNEAKNAGFKKSGDVYAILTLS